MRLITFIRHCFDGNLLAMTDFRFVSDGLIRNFAGKKKHSTNIARMA